MRRKAGYDFAYIELQNLVCWGRRISDWRPPDKDPFWKATQVQQQTSGRDQDASLWLSYRWEGCLSDTKSKGKYQ